MLSILHTPFKHKFIQFVFIFISTIFYGQTLTIHSISTLRQTGGDFGYTLDGGRMIDSRSKLLNPTNFGPSGTHGKSIALMDAYSASNGLVGLTNLAIENNLFFFGEFDKLNSTTQQFTQAEVDAFYTWSKKGGKAIISAGQYVNQGAMLYDGRILNKKWGFSFRNQGMGPNPRAFIATTTGATTDIFSGPFGTFTTNPGQGGSLQGYFDTLTTYCKILAVDQEGFPNLIMDCNTLDLIVSDVDAYTDLGMISTGSLVTTAQDQFWANTIAFMDKLQPLPVIANTNDTLSLNSSYLYYQWYNSGTIIPGANTPTFAPGPGKYSVLVRYNGGCTSLSSEITIEEKKQEIPTCEVFVPTAFSPNGNGINDQACVYGKCIKSVEFKIFDRWGEIVFETNDKNKCWDGTYRGVELNEAVFAYTLKATLLDDTQITKKGNITLVR